MPSQYGDRITLMTMTALTTNQNGSPNWVDLSAYRTGAIWAVVTAISGTTPSLALTFNSSPNNGSTSIALPTTELATPAAITTVSTNRFPFLVPNGAMNVGWLQSVATVTGTTPSVTGVVYFIGHV